MNKQAAEVEALYEEQPYGYVYRTTNKVNGKTYVGKHLFRSEERWNTYLGSGVAIKKAVKKYGKENFKKSVLATADNSEELAAVEVSFIKKEWREGKGEYNLVLYTPETIDFETLTEEENTRKTATLIRETGRIQKVS